MKPQDILAVVVCSSIQGCSAASATSVSPSTARTVDDGALIAAAESGTRDRDALLSAFERLSASCQAADLGSCTLLGRMYEHGLAVPASPARALALFMSACSGGSPPGCTQLARAYLSGLAGPADEDRGVALLSNCCFEGYAPACSELNALCRGDRRAAVEVGLHTCELARASAPGTLAGRGN